MNYGDLYKNWKGWTDSSFASLNDSQAAYYRAELGSISKELNSSSKVLEIGFGNGPFLKFATLQGWEVTGVETNKLLHELALADGYKSILSSNLDQLEDSTFDLVAVFDVIEHIPKSELIEFFSKVNALLKPDGVFISTFPNGDSPFSLYNQNGDLTHETHIGSQAIKFLAETTGFNITKIRPPAQPLFPRSIVKFAHSLVSRPLRFMIDSVVRVIWYPTSPHVHFTSNVITTILKKKS
jgi:2-polyprenyl-3-methyl-5-hydroxy-6-metoxy-1,4-benzoquinol methylase